MANLFSLFYGVLNFLFVAAAVTALVISIIARKRYPKRATFALIGFGLFAFDGLFWFVYRFAASGLLSTPVNLGLNVLTTLLEVGGFAMLVMALFRSDEQTPQTSQAGQYQQPQQQYPGQQYPGQQPQSQPYQPQQQPYQPQQQPHQPQQQPYPGQQYPQQGGQQYPGGGY